MRRRSDDWINATHILKAAGFDKVSRIPLGFPCSEYSLIGL